MNSPVQPEASVDCRDRSALLKAIRGFRVSQMIAVAAKLRIAHLLTEGPKSIEALAVQTGCHEDSLYRLLRALASFGVFIEEDLRHFRLSPMAEFLRSDVPGTLRANAEVVSADWIWGPWGALQHSIKTGQPAYELLFGRESWDWFDENPQAARLFDRCMDESTAGDIASILAGYDFGRGTKIVDVAGGRGILLEAIIRQSPGATGVLFNLPSVIDSARALLDSALTDRIELVAGSFFQAVPSGGDLYILKNILHDWNDQQAAAILASCAKAMHGTARLLIIEHLVGAPNQNPAGKVADILMMVRTGGRNRTEQEFRELLSTCGFNLAAVFQTEDGPSILEASCSYHPDHVLRTV